MIKHLYLALLLSGLLAPTLSVPVQADDDHEQARRLVESGDILPLESILQKHRQTAPGHILEVELEIEQGVPVYEIEWLDDSGHVHEWLIDARSGERVAEEGD